MVIGSQYSLGVLFEVLLNLECDHSRTTEEPQEQSLSTTTGVVKRIPV